MSNYRKEMTRKEQEVMTAYAIKHSLSFDDAVEHAAKRYMDRNIILKIARRFLAVLNSPSKSTKDK